MPDFLQIDLTTATLQDVNGWIKLLEEEKARRKKQQVVKERDEWRNLVGVEVVTYHHHLRWDRITWAVSLEKYEAYLNRCEESECAPLSVEELTNLIDKRVSDE